MPGPKCKAAMIAKGSSADNLSNRKWDEHYCHGGFEVSNSRVQNHQNKIKFS